MSGTLTLHLDGRARAVRRDLWRAWLGPGEPNGSHVFVGLDPSAPVRWRELDRLSQLREIKYQGSDAGIEAYVKRRRAITRLGLTGHRRKRIDLRGSALTELLVDLSGGPLQLRVPSTLEQVTFMGPGRARDVRVEGAAPGLSLGFAGVTSPEVGVVCGLERAHRLGLVNVPVLSIEDLTPYRELEELSLVRVGRVRGLAALTRFPGLRRLHCLDCYDLDCETLPALASLPSLTTIEAHGLRRRDAATLKRRLAEVNKLSLRGMRSDAWLRANLNNPFREWADEYGVKPGKGASAAWKRAVSAIQRAASRTSKRAVREALQGFIAALAKVATKHPFDTTMREDADAAYEALIEQAGPWVDVKLARKWFGVVTL